MQCYVYKSQKKSDIYLYILEKDNFAQVPEALQNLMGDMKLVLNFDLTTQRSLAREDIEVVRKNLSEQGFHLQLPDQTHRADQDNVQHLAKH